jgi:hypothetical protein
MESYLYLSLIPEALILSQLPPDKFGRYIATGSKRQIEGPAVFFRVDSTADLTGFRMAEAQARCKVHADGSPRRSVYVAIYDVLRRVPLDALQEVFLTTPAGVTLGLKPGEWSPAGKGEDFFLYQELGPVYPRVASKLNPVEFCTQVTSGEQLISLPALAFIDLKLGGLAFDPEQKNGREPPYQHLDHIRECLRGLPLKGDQPTKIVNRGLRPDILFSFIRSGVFVGAGGRVRFFPLPGDDKLESTHLMWWRSAQALKGY